MTSYKYIMTWNSCLLWLSKVTGYPGELFLIPVNSIISPWKLLPEFGENQNNSLSGLPQGRPSLSNTFYFLPRGVFLGSCSGVCCPALQILTLFQSNSYKVNVREYFPMISYVKKWGLSIIDLVTAKHIQWRQPHPRRHGRLVGMIECLWWKFTVRLRWTPGHLLLPNQFQKLLNCLLLNCDWPEKKFRANQQRGTAGWL